MDIAYKVRGINYALTLVDFESLINLGGNGATRKKQAFKDVEADQ